MTRSPFRPALLAPALALACAAPPDAPAPPPVREAAIDLEIGAADGDGPDVFGRISGLALLDGGRILVLDGTADQARVFGPDGAHRFSFARSGAGPGELSGACCVGVDGQGRVWIRDGGNARYDVFAVGDTAAAYLFSVRMGHGDVNYWAPVTFDPAGRLIDIGHRPDGGSMATVRLHTDSAGVVADSTRIPAVPNDSLGVRVVTRSTPAGSFARFLYPPYGPLELIGHGPGGQFARAVSSAYRISWFRPDGSLLRLIEDPGRTGPPVSQPEKERARAMIDDDAERFQLAATERFAVPDRKQPLSHLAFDDAGRLWIVLSAGQGAPRSAEVRDSTGALLFTARWPADVDPSFTGLLTDSVGLAVRRDSLGVERVVRIRWSAAGSGPTGA